MYMIHLSEYVKLAELETQQVIVKSYGQHTYLEDSSWILCKRKTFVSGFMPQTLYFHVFRWISSETLTFCEIKFGHKNTPKPRSPGIIMQYIQNTFIFLGTLNVRVGFKHKNIVVKYTLP